MRRDSSKAEIDDLEVSLLRLVSQNGDDDSCGVERESKSQIGSMWSEY